MTEALLTAYFVLVASLTVFGAHRLLLLWLYVRHREGRAAERPPQPEADLPRVVVQLPVYDEPLVVARLLEAAAALDWPRDRLEVQLLDDSDDETPRIAAATIARLASRGVRIDHVRRGERRGFKAGALAHGLARTRADLAAVFDADFVPAPDFLRRASPHFLDPRVAVVQARWTHLNAGRSALTRAQATLLDGHFVLEHGARHRSGRFFNFNGTAGIWRIAAIEDAGGWQADTLTEDLDLSYRAQLRGWRFVFLPTLTCPGELPARVSDFKSQQHRWAKGSVETARKLLPRIWQAPLPLRVRLEATLHLLDNLAHPLMLALLLLAPAALRLRGDPGGSLARGLDVLVFLLSTASLHAFYAVAAREAGGGPLLRRVVAIPFVLSVGLGLSVNNARGVWEALVGRRSAFVRTPKTGGSVGFGSGTGPPPVGRVQLALEVGVAAWLTAAVLDALQRRAWASVAVLLLLQVGPTYLAARSVAEAISRSPGPALTRAAKPARRAATTGAYSTHGTHVGSDQLAASSGE